MVICETCGVELPMPGAFCSACGAPLPRSVATMAPAAAPVPGSPWAGGTANPMEPNPLVPSPAAASPATAVPGGPRPIAFPMATPGARPPMLAPSQAVVVSRRSVLGKLVGVAASIGIMAGARFEWAGTQSAFKAPVLFLIDSHTRSRDPRIGLVLFGIGIMGVIVSVVLSGGIWRVLLGGLTTTIALVFCIQIQRTISDSHLATHVSLTDILGGGVWCTAIAGIVLALSPLLDRANFG